MDGRRRAVGALLTTMVMALTSLGLGGPAIADAPLADDGAVEGGPAGTAAPAVEVQVPTQRLGGSNRFHTAAAISREQFPQGSPTVYLARSDVFADALAAGSLTDGPVLLVRSCGPVPGAVSEEIARLDPTEVVALGGTGAVCDETLQAAAAGRSADRVAGESRFETAALIAERSFPDGAPAVYLAEHDGGADAVVAGTLRDGPVLLVGRGSPSVAPSTLAAIEGLDPAEVVAIGGEQAISPAALTSAASGRTADRLAGKNRYATSVAVAERAFPEGSDRTYLANGIGLADAVVGGVLTRGPVLLVPSDCRVLPEPVWRRVSMSVPDRMVALGGSGVVCGEQLTTGARMAVFSGMESGDTARLYDLVTKTRTVEPLRYAPADLVSWRGTSYRLRPEVATMLDQLVVDATAAGHPGLYVRSAYRSYDEQADVYAYWVALLGQEQADLISARPGHSEHQLGLAVDVAGPSCDGWDCFGDTPEGRWVAANAHRYGFIIRYPEGGTPVTGYAYEPWHLRYVGPRAAWMMHVRDEIYWDTYRARAVADGTF